MAKDNLQYRAMVETALRGVVRQALAEAAKGGLPGKHHFYITFRTTYPGVELPDHLKARYPSEMTIVLQFQFYDLQVDDQKFSVTLTFNNIPARLVIPLRAITIFADPSVNFQLPFQPSEPPPQEKITPVIVKEAEKPGADPADKNAAVVSLDQFRRK
jgi:hypothetical protein